MANKNLSQKLVGEFTSALGKKLNSQKFIDGVKAMGIEAINIIRQRNAKGIDVEGFKFDKYSKKYPAQKAKIISGKYKTKSAKGEFAATSVGQWMRLSGQLFRDMKYKVGRTRQPRDGMFVYDFSIYIDKASQGKAEGLMKKRKFWGIATEGNQRFLEQSKLIKAFTNATGLKGTGNIK